MFYQKKLLDFLLKIILLFQCIIIKLEIKQHILLIQIF